MSEAWKTKRIMVCDDEEFCIAAMQSMLSKVGIDIYHHVDFCINGREAIKAVKKCNEMGFKYKLIFTDFNMPVMDGIEATKQIR